MIRIDDERGEKSARAPAGQGKSGACWRASTEDKGSARKATPTKVPEEKIRIVTLCNSLLHKVHEDIIQRICASVSCTKHYK